jgi:hypothetical protein
VTDPEVAALPGGHTSKAISGSLMERKRVDHIVLQIFPEPRAVEKKLLRDPYVESNYQMVWISPENLPVRYELLAGRPARSGQ